MKKEIILFALLAILLNACGKPSTVGAQAQDGDSSAMTRLAAGACMDRAGVAHVDGSSWSDSCNDYACNKGVIASTQESTCH